VTGFGLLGHLLEMASASDMAVALDLDALPLLEGATACARAGITSSLQSANLHAEQAIENASAFQADARYSLLFDPQTAGGLLASMPAANAQACLDALHAAGYAQACVIGRVFAPVRERNAHSTAQGLKRIRLCCTGVGA
jgi:selenide,water dikinase